MFFCCKQKTAYELRISDWSSAVCAAYLRLDPFHQLRRAPRQVAAGQRAMPEHVAQLVAETVAQVGDDPIGRAAVGAGVAAVLDQADACLGRTQGVVGRIDRAIEVMGICGGHHEAAPVPFGSAWRARTGAEAVGAPWGGVGSGGAGMRGVSRGQWPRSEEHTSELQSLMRN